MINKYLAVFLLAVGVLATGSAIALDTYTGTCDASAVALLDDGRFIVASDESEDDLNIYDFKNKSMQSVVKLDDFLEHPKSEADLEGVTRIGDTLIWIGSHGRNKKGEFRSARHVLFATGPSGNPQGTPYRNLAENLSNHPKLAELNLKHAIRFEDEGRFHGLAPKQSGLNIEGLAATPQGKLLIGFRNPLSVDKRAILVPMTNPIKVLKEGEQPEFEKPILLDLEGLGIRSIEYVSGTHAAYYVLAGPKCDGKVFLYRWSGKTGEAPEELRDFGKRAAEGLALGPNGKRLFIVIDNGKEEIKGDECKDLDQAEDKRFYTEWVPLDDGS